MFEMGLFIACKLYFNKADFSKKLIPKCTHIGLFDYHCNTIYYETNCMYNHKWQDVILGGNHNLKFSLLKSWL